MAITSVGYDGTIDEKQFEAIMGYSAHSLFGVNAGDAFRASNVAGQVLQIRLSAGTAWTAGVVDVMDSAQTVQMASPPSTGSRWDMIVLRRDYQPPGGVSSLRVIKGTSAKSLPARENNAGVLSEQPLWLCRIDAGSGLVNEFIDLRVWARNGGCTANHDLVRSYMGQAGTMIEILGKLWIFTVASNGTGQWVDLIDASSSSAASGAGKLVRRDSTARFGVPEPIAGANPATKYYVDNYRADELKNGSKTLSLLGGGSLRAQGIYDQTAAIQPNLYVTSNGTLGRSTISMVTKDAFDFYKQDHTHSALNSGNRWAGLSSDGIGGFFHVDSVWNRTYDTTANVCINSNGTLGRATRSTSAKKYKTNIRDHAIDPAKVLALRPVIFDRPEGARDEFGLVADESVEDLPELVGYADGEVETFHYDRLPVAQHYVLKDHEARIAELEKKLDAALTLISKLSN